MTIAPLAAGIALSVVGGIVRVRAWHGAMAEVAPSVRYRDVVLAHLGGAGFNGIIPAHGGDAVKLALLKRRAPQARIGQLLGSLAPPAAVEALLTAMLLIWALSTGVLGTPSPGQIPLPLVGVALAAAAGLLWLLARKAPTLLRDVRSGMTALKHPETLAMGVLPWVLLARLIRLAALGCFVAAVGLPATLAGALLVMAIQGGVGSTGPASAPVRMAVLAASLPAAVGVGSVSLQTAAELIGATQGATMAVNLAISVLVLGVTLRTFSPRRVAAYCRASIKAHRPAPAAPKP
jgi:hypothetical protein